MVEGQPIAIVRPVPETFRQRAAHLYLQAFWGKLHWLLGNELEKAASLFAPTIRPDRAFAAVGGGKLLGLAGFKDHQGGFLGGGLADLMRHFGWFSGLWRGLVLELLEREPRNGELLMDGILVAPEARGKGIGTRLMTAIEDLARTNGAHAIRLDVIDTNPAARRLYERLGFEPVRTEKSWILKPLFGFNASTEMKKTLD